MSDALLTRFEKGDEMAGIDWGETVTAALDVADYDRSLAWYRDILGWEVVFELPDWGWAQLQTSVPGVIVGIGQSEEGVKAGGGATLTFAVADIDVARTYLEGAGVRFDGETRQIEDMVRLATFYDPDGNALMLSQQVA